MADADLLKEQPAPNCQYRSQASDGATAGEPVDEARIKLDYERQCYKHAEIIARERLARLQAARRQTAHRSDRAEVRSLPTPN